MSNGSAGAGWADSAAADEWRANLRRSRQAAGPQGRTACGTVSEFGYCMSGGHTPACASSIISAVNKATWEPSGSPAADRAWLAAKAERDRMAAITRGGADDSAAALREAKATAAKAERAHEAALTRGGAAWARTGRNPGWFTGAG